jgi:hypothetical protein
MKRVKLQDMTADQLTERFTSIALAEYEASEFEDNAKFRRLFGQMRELLAEFKKRPIQQRRALMALYVHPNPQVRYMAAHATSDFAPNEVRRVCEVLIERNEYPQAANARMLVQELDNEV